MKKNLIALLAAITLLQPLFAEARNASAETIALWPAGTPGIESSWLKIGGFLEANPSAKNLPNKTND